MEIFREKKRTSQVRLGRLLLQSVTIWWREKRIWWVG